jgi:hypothetical protein
VHPEKKCKRSDDEVIGDHQGIDVQVLRKYAVGQYKKPGRHKGRGVQNIMQIAQTIEQHGLAKYYKKTQQKR